MDVFPTLVGVFLKVSIPFPDRERLPHARGGVSIETGSLGSTKRVFPTLVGVFLVRAA